MTKKTEGAEASHPFDLLQTDSGRAVFVRHYPPGFTHIRWELIPNKGLEGENAAEVLMPAMVFDKVAERYFEQIMENQPHMVLAMMANAILSPVVAHAVTEWLMEPGRGETISKMAKQKREAAAAATEDLPESD